MSVDAQVQSKNFDAPDHTVRPWERVRVDVLELLDWKFIRVTTEPGWTWREHSAPIAGTDRCQQWHVKLFLSGRFAVAYEDGAEAIFGPGDLAVIQPGHDAWVVGDEPVVFLSLGELLKGASG